MAALPPAGAAPKMDRDTLLQRQIAFGYTFEDQRLLIGPMGRDGVEAVGSMGDDTPLAVLSAKPRLLYDYFKQLFAQVTNPPIDCIREELITSHEMLIGPEGNLLQPRPADCRQLALSGPVLTNEDFARLRPMKSTRTQGWRAADPVSACRAARLAWSSQSRNCASWRGA